MKKMFLLGAMLVASLSMVSCDNSNNVSNESFGSSSNSSSVFIPDYSLFDNNIVGTWYVHSNAQGLLELNDLIVIKSTYEAVVKDINFKYVGLYENYEGACLFVSNSGTTQLIASCDEEGILDWGIIDTFGNQDFGYAKKEEHISGIPYSYSGTTWPMEQIKDYLDVDKDLPIFEHSYYYLFTGISQLYDEAAYCMIDLFDVSTNARDEYALELENAGYVFTNKEASFYTGYDSDHTYAIRLSQDGTNLCIFVYYYSTFYSE